MIDAVHIDDLAKPTFPTEMAEMFLALDSLGETISLEPETLCRQASAELGLDDFGSDTFLEPLRMVTNGLDGEAALSGMGRISAATQLGQLLKNRLLVARALTDHPEIEEIEVSRPIFIAGQPRTGTTHLHNLISSDPALRSLPYWEAVEPLPAPGEPAGDPGPRAARTEAALSVLNTAVPYFKRMHEMTTWHVHEEIHLLAMDFSTMFFETMATMPSYRDWYCATDQTDAYRNLKTTLKVLQWARRDRHARWILKTPQHLEQFGPLMTVFPDATVVVTHRDPVSVTASTATMLSYLARLSTATPDPVRIGHYWSARIEAMLEACERDRDLLRSGQSIDVRFHEFMNDDIATVERIYEVAEQPFTPSVRAAMEQFVASHPRGRHGRVLYDLADFDLSYEERRQALAGYVERFGVEVEAPGAG